jgi:hypothetical protein
MVGITLSPKQIKSAPLEPHDWLEDEVAASLRFGGPVNASPQGLATCMFQQGEVIHTPISAIFPVANVFVALGREGASIVQGCFEAISLAETLRHARLPDMNRLLACLKFIHQACREIRKEVDACLFALDQRGYCIPAVETHRSILSPWTRLIATRQIAWRDDVEVAYAAFTHCFSTSGPLPHASIDLDDAFPNDAAALQPAFGPGVVHK